MKRNPLQKRNFSGDPEEFRATLIEHLEELRDRLFRSILLIFGGWAVGWFAEPFVYGYMEGMIDRSIRRSMPAGHTYTLAFHTATEPFMLQMRLSFVIGLVLAFPFLVLQLWGFVAPGLKDTERKPFMRLAPYTVLLFVTGAGFCWLILPVAIGWFTGYLANFQDTNLIQQPGEILMLCLKMLLAFGVGFQLPLIVWVLGALNLLTADTLFRNWRQSATAIFVIAAVVTPSNDAFSMLMMAIPLVLLFIISIYAVKFTQAKQARNRLATSEILPPESNDDLES